MKPHLLKIKNDFKVFLDGINIVNIIFGPHYLYLKCFHSVLKSVSVYATIYMAGKIITLLTQNKSINALYIQVIMFIIINFVIDIIANIIKRKCLILESSAPYKHEALLTKKALSLEYEKAESPTLVSLRAQITENTNSKGTGVMWIAKSSSEILSGLVSTAVAVFMVIQLYTTNAIKHNNLGVLNLVNTPAFTLIFSLSIFILILSIVLSNQKNSKIVFDAYNLSSGCDSFLDYYSEKVFNENAAGKEIRIYSANSLIDEELKRTIIYPLKNSRDKIYKSSITYGMIPTLISVIMGLLIYTFVGLKALSGSVEIGKVVEFYGIIANLISTITLSITQFCYLKSNNSYLKQELEYLEINTNNLNGKKKTYEIAKTDLTIKFNNVSFKYPNTEKYVLKNFSAEFLPGEKCAIVGMNGSGKSTIIKLLCGLYNSYEGEILLNNIDIREFDVKEYQNLFSVVFQDFDLFAFSVGENVSTEKDYNSEKVWKTLKQVGVSSRIQKNPQGLNQAIYKTYDKDGIDVSGGEGQKIAIARALYKDSPIIILDEPTASLDPIAESEIYMNFNELSKNKSTIFISHRLSSCRFCEKIIVLKNGQLVEYGTHDDLLLIENGEYATLLNAQAQHYQ